MKIDPSKPYLMFFDDLLASREEEIYIPPPNSLFAMNAERRIMIFIIPVHLDPKTMTSKEIEKLVGEALDNSEAR